MNTESILQNHVNLCDEAYTMMLQENKRLKTGQTDFSKEHFDARATLLDALNHSVAELKALNEQGVTIGPRCSALLQTAQKKLMKLFMLDKENEKLLLKAGFHQQTQHNTAAIPATTAKSAYSQFLEQS